VQLKKFGYNDAVSNNKLTNTTKTNTISKEEVVIEEENNDDDNEVLDDTAELSKFSGKPDPDDVLLYAIPCIAPYHSLSSYKYRVKLTPGSLKRGKASKQCLELLFRQSTNNSVDDVKRNKELMKQITDNELVQAMIGNVKLSAPGVSKVLKKMKNKKK